MAGQVACGWAGAVMKKAISSIWAGAVTQNAKAPKTPKKLTDRSTEIAGYRVA